MTKRLPKSRNLLDLLRRSLGIIPAIALFTIMFITVASAVGRYLLGSPIPGMVEIVGIYLMPLVIWIYLPILQADEENVDIDIIQEKISDKTFDIIQLCYLPCITFIMLLAFLQFGPEAFRLYQNEVSRTGILQLPAFVPLAVIGTGIALLCIILTIHMGQTMQRLMSYD